MTNPTSDKKPLSLVYNCHMKGMPPNPHQDWQSYFAHCAATGTISGLRLEAIQPTPSINDTTPLSPAAQAAEALAARPLMEQVAALGDIIGEQTVGQIMAISQRAAAWLAANPPGQPVAIEPRGCPTPGACSCVELPAHALPLSQ